MKRKGENLRRTLRSIIGRKKDLSPWLDWFAVLDKYIESGYLEILPEVHEAYITEAALHTLSNTDDILMSIETAKRNGDTIEAICQSKQLWNCIRPTVRRLSVYSDYLHTADEAYKDYCKSLNKAAETVSNEGNTDQAAQNLQKPGTQRRSFALHVVEGVRPHNLIYTIVMQQRRHWWWPWYRTTNYNIITYK